MKCLYISVLIMVSMNMVYAKAEADCDKKAKEKLVQELKQDKPVVNLFNNSAGCTLEEANLKKEVPQKGKGKPQKTKKNNSVTKPNHN